MQGTVTWNQTESDADVVDTVHRTISVGLQVMEQARHDLTLKRAMREADFGDGAIDSSDESSWEDDFEVRVAPATQRKSERLQNSFEVRVAPAKQRDKSGRLRNKFVDDEAEASDEEGSEYMSENSSDRAFINDEDPYADFESEDFIDDGIYLNMDQELLEQDQEIMHDQGAAAVETDVHESITNFLRNGGDTARSEEVATDLDEEVAMDVDEDVAAAVASVNNVGRPKLSPTRRKRVRKNSKKDEKIDEMRILTGVREFEENGRPSSYTGKGSIVCPECRAIRKFGETVKGKQKFKYACCEDRKLCDIPITWIAPKFVEKLYDSQYVPESHAEIVEYIGEEGAAAYAGDKGIYLFQKEWRIASRVIIANPRLINMCFQMASPLGRFGPKFPGEFEGGYGHHGRAGAIITGDIDNAGTTNIVWLDPANRLNKRSALFRTAKEDYCALLIQMGEYYFSNKNHIYQSLKTAKKDFNLGEYKGNIKEVKFNLYTGRNRVEAEADEVEAFVVDGSAPATYSVNISDRPGLQFINYETGLALPMRYPLAFGEGGLFCKQPEINEPKTHSFKQFCQYALQTRVDENDKIIFNPLLHMGLLSEQILCEMYAAYEQKKIISANYFMAKHRNSRVIGANAARAGVVKSGVVDGKKVTFVSEKHVGTHAYKRKHWHDAIGMFRKHGDPDLFITMTCNPNWPEFREHRQRLKEAGIKNAKVDSVTAYKIFELKLQRMMDLILRNELKLGEVACYVVCVEYQSRGLPHAHLLLSFVDGQKIVTPADVDKIVSSELPGGATVKEKELREIITRWNLHECRRKCQSSVDPHQKVCKFAARKYSETTVMDDGRGFIQYKCRDNSRTTLNSPVVGGLNRPWKDQAGKMFTNLQVVPYNADLSLIFNCHINVEVCRGPGATRYLCKYLTKGMETALLEIGDDSRSKDQVYKYLKGRIIQPCEAAQKLLGYTSIRQSHSVIVIPLHLEGEESIIYTENKESEAATVQNVKAKLQQVRPSMITDYFAYNKSLAKADRPKMNILQFAEQHTFYARGGRGSRPEWRRRVRASKFPPFARFARIPTENFELFNLRLLLQTRVDPISFEDLRTVDGCVHKTFTAAVLALTVKNGNEMWTSTLEEAVSQASGAPLRSVFAMLLMHGLEADFWTHWKRYKHHLCSDKEKKLHTKPELVSQRGELEALQDLELILEKNQKKLGEYYEMEQAKISLVNNCSKLGVGSRSGIVDLEASVPDDSSSSYGVHNLNVDQQKGFEAIEKALKRMVSQKESSSFDLQQSIDPKDSMFFIDGPAGTGKSHLLRHVISQAERMGLVVRTMAATGIAASVYDEATTVHYRFKVSLSDDHEVGLSTHAKIKSTIDMASVDVFVWDEVLAQSKVMLAKIDAFFREIMCTPHLPFGGKLFIFGGDAKQTMPIVNNDTDPVDSHVIKSHLWKNMIKLALTKNMRTEACRLSATDEIHRRLIDEFEVFQLAVGEGRVPTTRGAIIEMPKFLISQSGSLGEFIREYFPIERINDTSYIAKTCMMALLHQDVNYVNEFVLQSGEDQGQLTVREYLATDTDITEIGVPVASEKLLKIRSSQLPLGELRLAVGVPVILMRNCPVVHTLADESIYLGNGTRCIVSGLGDNILKLRICSGMHKDQEFLLPRFRFTSLLTEIRGTMTRVQFAVKVAYAITVNKAQSLTLERSGVYINGGCFAHGQLYVAMSRVGDPKQISFFLRGDDNRTDRASSTETSNIVSWEIMKELEISNNAMWELGENDLLGKMRNDPIFRAGNQSIKPKKPELLLSVSKRPRNSELGVTPMTPDGNAKKFKPTSSTRLTNDSTVARTPIVRPRAPVFVTPGTDRQMTGRLPQAPQPARNFAPYAGLINPENACFVNAAVQSLRMTNVLVRLQEAEQQRAGSTRRFVEVFERLQRSTVPFDAAEIQNRFAFVAQDDSMEVISFIFEKCHWGCYPLVVSDVRSLESNPSGDDLLQFAGNGVDALTVGGVFGFNLARFDGVCIERKRIHPPLQISKNVGSRSLLFVLKSIIYCNSGVSVDDEGLSHTQGHYIASVLIQGRWLLFNDAIVSEFTEPLIQGRRGVRPFYEVGLFYECVQST